MSRKEIEEAISFKVSIPKSEFLKFKGVMEDANEEDMTDENVIKEVFFLQTHRDIEDIRESVTVTKEAVKTIEGHSFFIFDSETGRLYHTTIETDSLKDLLTKWMSWDMESDPESLAEQLANIKSDVDAENYFRDRGCVVLESDKVEEF